MKISRLKFPFVLLALFLFSALAVSARAQSPIMEPVSIQDLEPTPVSGAGLPPSPLNGISVFTQDLKPTLSVFLNVHGGRYAGELRDLLGLSPEQVAQLEQIKREEVERVDELKRLDRAGAISVDEFNRRTRSLTRDSRLKLEAMLTQQQYQKFLGWFGQTWRKEAIQQQPHCVPSRSTGTLGSNPPVTCEPIYATQYDSEAGSGAIDAAVPDKYVRFAVRGWEYHDGYPRGLDYTVHVFSGYTNKWIWSVLVYDAGPWNVDDNYWDPVSNHPRPRRMFTDLDICEPEAYAAYYYGYNGGKDQYGRTVLNPGGLDLSRKAAELLGWDEWRSDWVHVEYNWER